jgi:MFS family permease
MLNKLAIDITPLKVSRDYRLLFFGQMISFFGTMMSFVAIQWQIFDLTKSSAMVGYISIAEVIPMIIFGLIGGAIADSFDKRKILRFTEIGQTIVTGIALANCFLPQPQIWIIFLVAGLHAAFAALQRPAFESFIQKVIPNDLMSAVMALNSMRWSLSAIISPLIAGIIATSFGVSIAYTIDFLSFFASLIAVFMISKIASPPNADKPSIENVISGWKYALKRQDLLGTYLIDIAAMFFAFPQALYPALAVIYGKQYLGLFLGSIAVGALLASATSGWTKHIHRHGVAVILAAIGWGIGITAFGLSNNLWLALACLSVAGFADMLSGIFRGSIWNQTIPNHLRGRLASIEMMSYLIGPYLGSAKMGVIAEMYGEKNAIISGGIMCIAAVVILAIFLPKFFRYDGREGIKRKMYEEKLRESGFVN